VRVSDAGTEVLGHMDAGKMYAMGRDNMPAKTRDKFMVYLKQVMKDPVAGVNTIDSDLDTIIRAKYREKGVKRSNTEITQEVTEQRNLWLAAGYSILSSRPGAGVMTDYFESATPGVPKPADDIKDDLINEIMKYKK